MSGICVCVCGDNKDVCVDCMEDKITELKKGIELIDLITTNYTDVHHTEMMEISKIVNDLLKPKDDINKIKIVRSGNKPSDHF